MMSAPSPTPRLRRAYDHRLREHVVRSGVRSLGRHVGIPRSTVSTWQRRGLRPVVTIEPLDHDRQRLLESVAKLDRRARVLAAVVRLLLALLRVSGFSLAGRRLPEGAAKANMPLRTLALYAQRVGKVFASATTWAKLVREHGWRRPRRRLYPPKPTVGVRATQPNEAWHVDTTIIRLLDGTRAYIHATIDNFSRKILAWTVAARLEPTTTCQVLFAAGKHLVSAGRPLLSADSGIENINGAVDDTLFSACLERVLAQVEVTFSNSMIEAFWRSLKHQCLYLNSLDSIERLRSLVKFYVEQHNTQMPHAAFSGQTPDEMYFGTAVSLPAELAAASSRARTARIATNRALSCTSCLTPPVLPQSQIPP